MICPKCACKVFKPEHDYRICFLCCQHIFSVIHTVVPSLKPQKMFGNKTQEERTKQVKKALADNWDAIVQLRSDGITWSLIAESLDLVGCLSSLSKHFKTMLAAINQQAVCGRKRVFVNPCQLGRPRTKLQELGL